MLNYANMKNTMHMKQFLIIIPAIILSSCITGESQEPAPDLRGNHHIHNFRTSDEMAMHAVAMGYSMVCRQKPDGPEFRDLGLIQVQNARVGPIRVFIEMQTGKVFVRYHATYSMSGGEKCAIAHQYGLERKVGELYPLTGVDWEIIRSYNAMKKDAWEIPFSEVTESTFEAYFARVWTLEDERYRAFNLGANWQSKRVVNDFLRHLKAKVDWKEYNAMFLDGINNIDVEDPVNLDFGGMGHYQSPREGQHDFMNRMRAFLREPDSTGNEKPLLLLGNIWSPLEKGGLKLARAYAENTVRYDHYYFERGGVGEQHPNGVVPGTDLPAYVDPENPDWYIPASRVALDDVYAYNNAVHKGAVDFDRHEHFIQHLDACGTAGLYGAWFGWYGEDYVTLKDGNGKLVYTNDLQLLRAIPNWDNLHGTPVAPFGKKPLDNQRTWDNSVYRSPASFASKEVIYSESPFNGELYVVFRDERGSVDLKGGEIAAAWWVDDWFGKTGESAMDALEISGGVVNLKPGIADRRPPRGIRMILKVSD